MLGVDLGNNWVLRLFVPPSVGTGVGTEALLFTNGARSDDCEQFGAGETDGVEHLLIFFALENPSTFTVAADCPTPSPGGPGLPCVCLV